MRMGTECDEHACVCTFTFNLGRLHATPCASHEVRQHQGAISLRVRLSCCRTPQGQKSRRTSFGSACKWVMHTHSRPLQEAGSETGRDPCAPRKCKWRSCLLLLPRRVHAQESYTTTGPKITHRTDSHLHVILIAGTIYIPHALEPLKRLGLDHQHATQLAFRLNAHSNTYAHKLAGRRNALAAATQQQRTQRNHATSFNALLEPPPP